VLLLSPRIAPSHFLLCPPTDRLATGDPIHCSSTLTCVLLLDRTLNQPSPSLRSHTPFHREFKACPSSLTFSPLSLHASIPCRSRNNSAVTIILSPQSARSLVAYLYLSTAPSRADHCHQVTSCATNRARNLALSNVQLNSPKPCPSTRLPSTVGVDPSPTPMTKQTATTLPAPPRPPASTLIVRGFVDTTL
jgi:hypothetical protein